MQLTSFKPLTIFPAWNGTSVFAQMGETPTLPATAATWGQAFSLPPGHRVLRTYSYWLSDSPVFYPDPLDFAAYLMQWNGQRATGPILYQSAVQTIDGVAHGEFRRFDFRINRNLDPGNQYIFFISNSQFFDGIPSMAFPAGLAADIDPSSHLVNLDNESDFTQITTTSWHQTPQWDMVFEARFDIIPTPTAAVLGAAAFVLLIKRRR